MTPFETSRMRWLPNSAMYKLPSASTAIPLGRYNWALVAGPLSPLKPCVPFPATRVKTPVLASNRRTAFPSPKKTLPDPSTATELGEPKAADVPGMFTGSAPPANV
jgi:hypothetical protein